MKSNSIIKKGSVYFRYTILITCISLVSFFAIYWFYLLLRYPGIQIEAIYFITGYLGPALLFLWLAAIHITYLIVILIRERKGEVFNTIITVASNILLSILIALVFLIIMVALSLICLAPILERKGL